MPEEITIDTLVVKDILTEIDRSRLQIATALNELDTLIVKLQMTLRKERDSDG